MPEQNEYKVVIQVDNTFTEATAATPLEAFLKIQPEKTTIKAIITVSKGDKKWTIAGNPLFLKKLIDRKPNQELFNSNAIKFLNG